MYSPPRATVKPGKKGSRRTFGLLLALLCGGWAQPEHPTRPLFCDARFTALFTPRIPQLGRYEVCAVDAPLSETAPPEWPVEALPALDAFGAAGRYDRSAVARLYGGRRASVARGWRERNGQFESITLISPHPDPTLTRLMPGTLVVRLIICCT